MKSDDSDSSDSSDSSDDSVSTVSIKKKTSPFSLERKMSFREPADNQRENRFITGIVIAAVLVIIGCVILAEMIDDDLRLGDTGIRIFFFNF